MAEVRVPKCDDLRIEECLDEELHRYVRTRLFDEPNVLPSKKLPKLFFGSSSH